MTFLNTIECGESVFGVIYFWFVLGSGIFLAIIGIIMAIDAGEPACLWVVFVGFLLLILATLLGKEMKDNKNKIRYEVTIDKTVPFVEVMENYNVIEQRGDIYILEVK